MFISVTSWTLFMTIENIGLYRGCYRIPTFDVTWVGIMKLIRRDPLRWSSMRSRISLEGHRVIEQALSFGYVAWPRSEYRRLQFGMRVCY